MAGSRAMAGKIGIRDVARAASVSVGTVSKVLSPRSGGPVGISEGIRERVVAAAKRLCYTPSYGATLLRGKRTGTIGLITNLPGEFGSTCISQYQMRILNGISARALARGCQVLLVTGGDYASYLDIRRVDAMAVVDFRLRSNRREREMLDMYRAFNARRHPYVVINSTVEEVPVPCVNVDNDSGMEQVAALVLRKDYGSVGFVGSIAENPQRHHVVRLAALQRCLEAAGRGIPGDLRLLGPDCGIPPMPRTGSFDHRDGMAAVEFLQGRGRLPRCLVCGNDDVAQGIVGQAARLGIRVPEDLAVVGFDDQPGSEFWNPPLTTVRQPLEEMGEKACEFLFEAMDDPDAFRQTLLKPTLLERASA